MNRIGLIIAFAVAGVVGGVFAVHPRFDLDLAAPFFDAKTQSFNESAALWVRHARDLVRLIVTLIVAPACLAVVGKLLLPRLRMLIDGRAAMFLIATLALGPGILTNVVLKDHWGRARPINVTEFGGADRFTPWWDPRGPCPDNCSFVAGEPSGAFWAVAPASLAPPQWRLAAYGAALSFGAAAGALRMVGGAHFFTDVVFAGVFMFLVAWTLHGLIYRWRPTRIGEAVIDRLLAQAGMAARRPFAALARRRGDGKDS